MIITVWGPQNFGDWICFRRALKIKEKRYTRVYLVLVVVLRWGFRIIFGHPLGFLFLRIHLKLSLLAFSFRKNYKLLVLVPKNRTYSTIEKCELDKRQSKYYMLNRIYLFRAALLILFYDHFCWRTPCQRIHCTERKDNCNEMGQNHWYAMLVPLLFQRLGVVCYGRNFLRLWNARRYFLVWFACKFVVGIRWCHLWRHTIFRK